MIARPSRLLPPRTLRRLLWLGGAVGFGLIVLAFLLITQSVLTVWSLLQDMPGWFLAVYVAVLALLSAAIALFVASLLRPKRPRTVAAAPSPPPDPQQLARRIEEARREGVATTAPERELAEWGARNTRREVYVALFGSISVGKSSLIAALVPDAHVSIDPRGGTTREVRHYRWQDHQGHPMVLTDLPGLFEPGGELSAVAKDETHRADIVVYICDGDLTRDQYHELGTLARLGKPLLLAFNKIDLYRQEDRRRILQRLHERLPASVDMQVVAIHAGGTEEAVRVHPDGREEIIRRERVPHVQPLLEALSARRAEIDEQLEQRRAQGFMGLGQEKLEQALHVHRGEQSRLLVRRYTRRAIVGSIAAVTPGSDILIQGYLGINLVQDLCRLYGASARQLDVRRFIDLAGQHVGKTLPLLLAIAGNVCKAFPGIGTVTGGIMHAVAYGLIFESLGNSVALTLQEHGELRTDNALRLFEEKLGEDLESRARTHARLVFEELSRHGRERMGK